MEDKLKYFLYLIKIKTDWLLPEVSQILSRLFKKKKNLSPYSSVDLIFNSKL